MTLKKPENQNRYEEKHCGPPAGSGTLPLATNKHVEKRKRKEGQEKKERQRSKCETTSSRRIKRKTRVALKQKFGRSEKSYLSLQKKNLRKEEHRKKGKKKKS